MSKAIPTKNEGGGFDRGRLNDEGPGRSQLEAIWKINHLKLIFYEFNDWLCFIIYKIDLKRFIDI